MLPPAKFSKYDPGKDPYAGIPTLKLDDLEPVDLSRPIKLSFFLCFTNWRMSQLARTLETLCRQSLKDFEVLICDDGSTQDMEAVYSLFRPYLNMKTFRLEREGFSGCPTRGIKHVLPHACGEVHVIMQPECMLTEDAAEYIYQAHMLPMNVNNFADSIVHNIGKVDDITVAPRWVCLRTGFFNEAMQWEIDKIDWHSNIRNIQNLPEFDMHTSGLGSMTNVKALTYDHWPWWFVGSCKADDGILDDMPVFVGHASIDFWLMGYRQTFGYIDIFPIDFKTYHQWHISGRVAPEGEAAAISMEEARRKRNERLQSRGQLSE